MKIIVKTHEKLIKFLIHNVQGLSFGQAQKLLRKGDIKVNGKRTKDNIDVNIGDEIDIYLPVKNKPIPNIIYEDDNIIIINKPAGMECATRDKSSENTYSVEELFEDTKIYIVHRLDRLTEGLLILAKNKDIAKELEEIFRTRQISKYYMAGVNGNCTLNGIYTAFLYKDSNKSLVTVTDTPTPYSKEIITEFNVIHWYSDYSLIDVKLHTGRTHQIRAHLKFLGYPIINDSKYGQNQTSTFDYNGYFLTSYKLEFNITGKLNYLNDKVFKISPSWLKYLEN